LANNPIALKLTRHLKCHAVHRINAEAYSSNIARRLPKHYIFERFEAKQGATGNIREDVGADLPVSLNRIEVAETWPF
jgi:hypothetical protein